MRLVIAGATGRIGAQVLDEALARGHDVTAVVRDPSRLPTAPGLTVVAGDVFDPEVLARAAAGCEVLVAAVALRDDAQRERTPTGLARALMAASLDAGARLVMLGGAGSLEVAPGIAFVDTPGFPDPARPESEGFRAALQVLRSEAPADLSWTVLSPPAVIDSEGERTSTFRAGTDRLLRDSTGASRISTADLAIALVDEVEHPQHRRARFTVAY